MLTHNQLNEIKSLQHSCEKNENFRLKLNWDMLETTSSSEKNDFLFYKDNQLIGFVGLYGFGNKVEICGMVHPNHRRRGIFLQLITEALTECKNRKITNILLNAPANSTSAKAFLTTIPCHFAFSEFQMKWSETDHTFSVNENVSIRLATDNDAKDLIQLDVDCFDFNLEDATTFHNEIKNAKDEKSYIIEYSNETVGKIRIQRANNESWIYGFSVFPKHQGKGIGRNVLLKVIEQERKLGHGVFLEVEFKNEHAKKLYTSTGFVPIETQDYYKYQL